MPAVGRGGGGGGQTLYLYYAAAAAVYIGLVIRHLTLLQISLDG